MLKRLPDLTHPPTRLWITDENGTRPLQADGPGLWGAHGITVETIAAESGGLKVLLHAPGDLIRRLHLRWDGPLPEGCRLLGDHWERGYGDLEWRGIVPERWMPWYVLLTDGMVTHGFGVETGAGALCAWQADATGISLILDVSNGSRGVLLGDRTLHAATIQAREGVAGETPFAGAQAFCRLLCPSPRLPDHVVYGSNNWYYAYGKSSHEDILRDTDILIAHAPDGPNRPYMVIDDGWQANRRDADWMQTQRGPWDQGNEGFPDMPGLAGEIADRGAMPGIWIRPLGAPAGTHENRLLPVARVTDSGARVPTLDPSIVENAAQIADDFRRLRGWGYRLIKHDWTTCDILGRWGFQMLAGELTAPNWHFADRSRTTAEIIRDLYTQIREASGDAVIIGCNTIGHLGAGLFELQRTGDDTSGQEWERTRKMGINTLAFRMPQHNTFFQVDADCVGLTRHVPWHLNRQWMDLLARSGTPCFISTAPDALGAEQAAALKQALTIAATPQPPGEPLDWLDTICPRRWRFGDEAVTYHWHL